MGENITNNELRPKLGERLRAFFSKANNSKPGELTIHGGTADVEIDSVAVGLISLPIARFHKHEEPNIDSNIEVRDKVKTLPFDVDIDSVKVGNLNLPFVEVHGSTKAIHSIPKEHLDTLSQKLLPTDNALPLPADYRPIGSKTK